MADRDTPTLPPRRQASGPDPAERETPAPTAEAEILARAGLGPENFELAKRIATAVDAAAYLRRSAGVTPEESV